MKIKIGSILKLRANRREGWREETVKVLEIEPNGVIVVSNGKDVMEITADQVK